MDQSWESYCLGVSSISVTLGGVVLSLICPGLLFPAFKMRRLVEMTVQVWALTLQFHEKGWLLPPLVYIV